MRKRNERNQNLRAALEGVLKNLGKTEPDEKEVYRALFLLADHGGFDLIVTPKLTDKYGERFDKVCPRGIYDSETAPPLSMAIEIIRSVVEKHEKCAEEMKPIEPLQGKPDLTVIK